MARRPILFAFFRKLWQDCENLKGRAMKYLPAILLLAFAAGPALADDVIDSGPRADIDRADYAEVDRHGVCRMVLNKTGRDVMIPIRTKEEWATGPNSFVGFRPDDMVIKPCPPSVAPTSGRRIYPHNYDTDNSTGQDEGDRFGGGLWVHPSATHIAIGSPDYSTVKSAYNSGSNLSGRIVFYQVAADGTITRGETVRADSGSQDRWGYVFDVADDMETLVTTFGHIVEKRSGVWEKVYEANWPYSGAAPADAQISGDGTKAIVNIASAYDTSDGVHAAHTVILYRYGGAWRQTRLRFAADDWARVKMTSSGKIYVALNDIARNGTAATQLQGGAILSSVIRVYELVDGTWTQTRTFRPFGTDPVSIDHFQVTDDESRIVIMSAPFGWDADADGDMMPVHRGDEYSTEPPFIATFDASGTSWSLTGKQVTSSLGIRGARPEDAADSIGTNSLTNATSADGFYGGESDIFELTNDGETIWAQGPTTGWVQLRDPDRDGRWESFPRVTPLDYNRSRSELMKVYSDGVIDAKGNLLLTADIWDTADPASNCTLYCGSGYLFDFRR